MTNPFANSFSPAGATSVFNTTFTMDSDLTYIDVVATLNGIKVTNFTKSSTTQLTFVAPLPSGTLKVERNTSGARKYVFTPGTRVVAEQVAGELDRLVASSLEDAQRSYTSYSTMASNAGAYVAIDPTGEHEVLTSVAPVAIYTTWGSPGALGNVAPNTGAFTTLSTTGLASLNSASLASTLSVTGATTLSGAVTFAGTQAQKDATLETLGGINPYNKLTTNYLENGDYLLSQRFVSDATAATGKSNPANNTYYLDRVVNLQTGTAATWTVSKQPFTLGQTAVPGNPQFFGQWAVTTAAGTTMGRARRIEGTARLSGKTMTYVFWARVTAGTATLSSNTRQYFGSGGSPSADVTTDTTFTAALTTTWTKFTKTYTFGSVSGKTLGTAGDDYTEIRLNFPLTNGVTYQIADEMLVEGTTSPFYYAREDYQENWFRCARYFRQFYWSWAGYLSAGGSNRLAHPLSPPMRTTPIRRLTAGDNTDIAIGTNLNTGTNVPALGGAFLGENTAIAIDVAAGGTGNAYVFDYILGADAELY